MPRPVRIALCQLNSSPNVEANLAKLEDYIKKAAADHANIAIFPEYYVQGIVSDAPHLIFKDGEVHTDVSQLAVNYKIDVVIGTLVERVAEMATHEETIRDHKVYNTCATYRYYVLLLTRSIAHIISTKAARFWEDIASGTSGIQRRTIYIQDRMSISFSIPRMAE